VQKTGRHRETLELYRVRQSSRTTKVGANSFTAWICSYEEGEGILNAKPTDRLLSTPSRAHSAQHHYAPTNPTRRMSQDGYIDNYDDASHGVGKKPETGFFGGHKEPVRGRKWDHARDGDPVIMQSGVLPTSSPWRTYIKASMYGPALDEDSKRVDEDFLHQQTPGYQRPWRGDLEGGNDPEKLSGLLHNKKQRRSLMKRVQVRSRPPICAQISLMNSSMSFLCTRWYHWDSGSQFSSPQ